MDYTTNGTTSAEQYLSSLGERNATAKCISSTGKTVKASIKVNIISESSGGGGGSSCYETCYTDFPVNSQYKQFCKGSLTIEDPSAGLYRCSKYCVTKC